MNIKPYIKNRNMIAFIAILLVLAVLDILNYHAIITQHLGVSFIGGTQIPITLATNATPSQMSQIISTLDKRLSTFGLSQPTIYGVGDREVLVTIHNSSASQISSTLGVIESQGVFQGVVSGRVAINGSSILPDSVGAANPVVNGTSVTWTVNFYLTEQASRYFSNIVFGQANKPLFLFLDRPSNSIVLINASILGNGAQLGSALSESEEVAAMDNATILQNGTIPVEVLSSTGGNWNSVRGFFEANRGRYRSIILQNSTPAAISSNLTEMNYTLDYVPLSSMVPQFAASPTGAPTVSAWPAIGLLTMAFLNPSITNGTFSQAYDISGGVPANLTLVQGENYAVNQTKTIESILSGGALPVQVTVGTPVTTPPTLGKYFEYVSFVALLLVVIAVSVVIAVRYRKAFLIVPIMITTIAELFIILSIIGLIGTIDIPTIAGAIAVIGTGVDAQIIITDEVLSKSSSGANMRLKLGNAFYIVWADAILLTIAMFPLLVSSLTSIIGFSESTIIGALLGAIITRPTYGAIIARKYGG